MAINATMEKFRTGGQEVFLKVKGVNLDTRSLSETKMEKKLKNVTSEMTYQRKPYMVDTTHLEPMNCT